MTHRSSVDHKQLRSHIADRMRSDILDGNLKSGEWLRQQTLAERYGVSQMPIREALKELEAEGLIEHLPYRGARVVEFSTHDVEDLYEHRAYLEGKTARLAAMQITPAELEQLKLIQAQILHHQSQEELAEYRRLNREFHEVIYRASWHNYLIRTLNQLWEAFPTMLWNDFAQTARQSLPARDASDIGEHEAIIAALEAQQPDEAERLMREHILTAGHELVATLKNH